MFIFINIIRNTNVKLIMPCLVCLLENNKIMITEKPGKSTLKQYRQQLEKKLKQVRSPPKMTGKRKE